MRLVEVIVDVYVPAWPRHLACRFTYMPGSSRAMHTRTPAGDLDALLQRSNSAMHA